MRVSAPPLPVRFYESEEADGWMWLTLADGWRPTGWGQYGGSECCDVLIDGCAMPLRCYMPQGAGRRHALKCALGLASFPEEEAAERGRALIDEVRAHASKAERGSRLVAALEAKHAAQLALTERWRELKDLPQLFIAT